jgi:hypothetical protein
LGESSLAPEINIPRLCQLVAPKRAIPIADPFDHGEREGSAFCQEPTYPDIVAITLAFERPLYRTDYLSFAVVTAMA